MYVTLLLTPDVQPHIYQATHPTPTNNIVTPSRLLYQMVPKSSPHIKENFVSPTYPLPSKKLSSSQS